MGAVLFYAGILTTADSMQVGIGMMIVGGILVALSIRQAVRRLQEPVKSWDGSVGKFDKRKRKPHLRIVTSNEEDERPTYH